MAGDPNAPCPLTEQDCANFQRILYQRCPAFVAELERLKRAGFNLEALFTDAADNASQAKGLLGEYFPTRMSGGNY